VGTGVDAGSTGVEAGVATGVLSGVGAGVATGVLSGVGEGVGLAFLVLDFDLA
jgi:hypothetical protein